MQTPSDGGDCDPDNAGNTHSILDGERHCGAGAELLSSRAASEPTPKGSPPLLEVAEKAPLGYALRRKSFSVLDTGSDELRGVPADQAECLVVELVGGAHATPAIPSAGGLEGGMHASPAVSSAGGMECMLTATGLDCMHASPATSSAGNLDSGVQATPAISSAGGALESMLGRSRCGSSSLNGALQPHGDMPADKLSQLLTEHSRVRAGRGACARRLERRKGLAALRHDMASADHLSSDVVGRGDVVAQMMRGRGVAPECMPVEVHEACLAAAGDGRVWLMPDSGANVSMFADALLCERSAKRDLELSVSGVWGGSGSSISQLGSVLAGLPLDDGGEHVLVLHGCIAPLSRRNVWSESQIWDLYGARVLKEPDLAIVWPDGARSPIERANGLYFLSARIIGAPDDASAAPAEASMATSRQIGQEQWSRTWAVRMGLRAEKLAELLKVSDLGKATLTALERRSADDDVFCRKAWIRRWSAAATGRVDEPGLRFVIDASGPFAAKSVVDGTTYELTAVCTGSSFGYVASASDVKQGTIFAFIVQVQLKEKALGHAFQYVRFDRVPNLSTTEFEQKLNGIGLLLELGGRNRHEAVAAVSERHDVVERRAEADVARARKGLGHVLPARVRHHHLMNETNVSGRNMSRAEHHGYGRFDFSKRPPYAFGCVVQILNEKGERGPKGVVAESQSPLGAGRQTEAECVGWSRDCYTVLSLRTGRAMHPSTVDPLNEHELVSRGVSAQMTTQAAGAQTDPVNISSAAAKPRQASSFPEITPYELTAPPDMRGPPSARTRSASAIAEVLLCFDGDLRERAAGALQAQYFPGLELSGIACQATASARMCALIEQLAGAETLAISVLESAEVNKAKITSVRVATPMGAQVISVPSNVRQLNVDRRREQWIGATRTAVAVILSTGNKLIGLADAREMGIAIFGCIVQRKLKLNYPGKDEPEDALPSLRDDADGGLNVRLCIDGERQAARAKQRGELDMIQVAKKAEIADHTLLKMQLAAAGYKGQSIAKADIGTAYPRGERLRPPCVMRLPPEIVDEFRAEDGREQGVLLLRPHFGEPPSGDEWDLTLMHVTLKEVGWHKAEGVPALVTSTLNGVAAQMSRVVDDTLFTEDQPPGTKPADFTYSAFDATLAVYKPKFEVVTSEREPNRFAGYSIRRRYDIYAINLHMAPAVEEVAMRYTPRLVEEGLRPSAHLLRGMTLQSLLDSLCLPPPDQRSSKLAPEQKRYQEVNGGLRFPEQCDAGLTLPLRKSSVVMSFPPLHTVEIKPISGGFYGLKTAVVLCVLVVDLLTERAYDRRLVGLTFGGAPVTSEVSFAISSTIEELSFVFVTELIGHALAKGAPMDLQSSSDATWARLSTADSSADDIVAVMVTFCGAAVSISCNGIKVAVSDSTSAEGLGITKGEQRAIYCRNVALALGLLPDGPTTHLTDNDSARLVVSGAGSAGRSKHDLRRYVVTMQRCADGQIVLKHVPDEESPCDFLTKWLSADKLRRSLAYATGSRRWHGEAHMALSRDD